MVSAHAMNGGGPTAQILERDGWKFEKDFVGHRKAVTCVRFNDNILARYDDVKSFFCHRCEIGRLPSHVPSHQTPALDKVKIVSLSPSR